MSAMRRVVAGVSGSPGSVRALRYALGAAADAGVGVLAVHTWLPPGGDLAERRHPSIHLRMIWEDAARQQLARALEDAGAAGVEEAVGEQLVRTVVVRGLPGPVLVAAADSPDDLLVVGAGRRGPLARLRPPGVGRYCLAHAACPVVAVPPSILQNRSSHRLRRWAFRHRELTVEQVLRERVPPRLPR